MEEFLFWMKQHLKDLILSILIIICLTLSIYSIFFKENIEEEVDVDNNMLNDIESVETKIDDDNIPKVFNVDVKGQVNNPGVYQVSEGTIINEVISLAGGFKDNANVDYINLSQRVSDEMVIFVYNKNDKTNTNAILNYNNNICLSENYNIEECVTKKESIIIASKNGNDTNNNDGVESEETAVININIATKDELMTLSGIGDAKAKAIIEYRNNFGKFNSIEDILNVSGIGDAIFAKIKDFITV